MQHFGAFVVGVIIGFLGGLFGKGGSAIATPLLAIVGFPGFIAVASPLPATIPGTLLASAQYWKHRLVDWQVVSWSTGVGIPATILGSLVTKFIGARFLLILTAIFVLGFGLSFLISPTEKTSVTSLPTPVDQEKVVFSRMRLALIAAGVGFISGLLANAGGFLLAPAYIRLLKLPIKKSFACSLAVSAALAIPGTIIHAYLGHISWTVTGLVALGSIPCSMIGARIAIRSRSTHLARMYGLFLTALGILSFFHLG
ncbi:MAG TPA: sulfite exporter TauE/SafE family protein [Candidatus Acidoferrales bacterium]|nr:sulfite exporter TauE/SafE family protein [Candidatus Acidoferrales bacterium]